MNTAAPIVSGLIIVTKNVPDFSNATIHIQLEDLSRADAGALLLAQTTIKDVKHDTHSNRNKPTSVPFEMHLNGKEEIDPRNFYGVRVWIDIDSNNRSRSLNTDQSIRVLTHGFGNFVEIRF